MRRPLRLAALAAVLLTARGSLADGSCVRAAGEAQELRTAGKLRTARERLLVCAHPSCNAVVRADCERWLREVTDLTPSLGARAVDARGRDVDATLTIDGVAWRLTDPPLPVDPGSHTLRAQARSGDVTEEVVLVAAGERARVVELRFKSELDRSGARVTPPPPAEPAPSPRERPSSTRTAVTTGLLGLGGVALLAFGWFEWRGQVGYVRLRDGCGHTHTCEESDLAPVRMQFTAAGIALGVSAVALGAAAVLWLTAGSPDRAAPRTQSGVRVDAAGIRF